MDVGASVLAHAVERKLNGLSPPKRVTVNNHEETMSKHDEPTKRHRRPKSGKRIDYTARTMAALKQLEKADKQKTKTA
jgi:hypothetical protein